MSKFRFGYATLLIVLSINHTHQSTMDLLKMPPTQKHQSQIANERSPISIIRIKPAADSEHLQSGLRRQRKQKSNGQVADGESNRDMSSVIVIKPILSPVAGYTAKKKVLPVFWKKMMRRPKFLHDIKRSDEGVVSRVARVHLAPGAYPVYYGLAKTNGNFEKIKSITYAGM